MMHLTPNVDRSPLSGSAVDAGVAMARLAPRAYAAAAQTHTFSAPLQKRLIFAQAPYWAATGRARRIINDNADADRRPPPGRNPGSGC